MTTLPILQYASLSDPGRVRLANEDACHCDDRLGLFVVCDGLGGRPSGEAASHIIAKSLSHLLKRRLRRLARLDAQIMRGVLRQVATDLNDELRQHSQAIPALQGMGATLAMLLIDGPTAYVMHAGDSRVYLVRGGQMQQLTADHFRMGVPMAAVFHRALSGDRAVDLVEQRLLTQYVGMSQPFDPAVSVWQLRPGDRFLLCSDGLTDPVESERIAAVLGGGGSLPSVCQALVNEANAAGGPDNITTVVVDYKGLKQVERASLRRGNKSPAAGPPRGVAAGFHDCLIALQRDLDWLLDGSHEAGQPSAVAAFSAVKRRLGDEAYQAFMNMHPSKNPSHVFHRAATQPEGVWRRIYETNHANLSHHLAELTAGNVRLSPILTPDETALILTSLWRDWRRVEKRYFRICQEADFEQTAAAQAEDERADAPPLLDFLIEHMVNSVRTLIGLMAFFPRYMRSAPAKAPAQRGAE